MRFLHFGALAFGVAASLTAFQPVRAANLVLITTDEAKLPPPQQGAVPISARGVTRGPKVELVSQAGTVHSPAPLQLKFQTFGGSKVDLDAVQATYLRSPNVDLTTRIKPFVTMTGINVPAAELPPGEHVLRIDIRDSDGRAGTASFLLKVEK
jgi:hypothetical protein